MFTTIEEYQVAKSTTEVSGQIITLFGASQPDFEITTPDAEGNEITLPFSKLKEMHENTLESITEYEKVHPEVLVDK